MKGCVHDLRESALVAEVIMDADIWANANQIVILSRSAEYGVFAIKDSVEAEQLKAVEVNEHLACDDGITPIGFAVEDDADVMATLTIA